MVIRTQSGDYLHLAGCYSIGIQKEGPGWRVAIGLPGDPPVLLYETEWREDAQRLADALAERAAGGAGLVIDLWEELGLPRPSEDSVSLSGEEHGVGGARVGVGDLEG